MKTYKKPKLLAKNNPKGTYAAGCPSNEARYGSNNRGDCKSCERSV